MTGFGRATAQEKNWILTWEIKSLNSRHLDLKWKIPPAFNAQQKIWENEVRAVAGRGSVELFLSLRFTSPELQPMVLDTTLAQTMFKELHRLAEEMGVTYTPDLNRLPAIPSMWQDAGSPDSPELLHSLTETLRRALAEWDKTRIHEGRALTQDLLERFERMEQLVESIRELTSQTAPERLALLRERVDKLLTETVPPPDEDRMLQELALMADRMDVSEELTRLGVHLESIRQGLEEDEPIGRKLDFMVQECFREINTCGNKCQNAQISGLCVEFKAELEKCREQIQNLE
jgi:uncharacterized protein (TIGR00255 family)